VVVERRANPEIQEEEGYSRVSKYVRSLIRCDQKETVRAALEAEVLKGLNSGESTPMTDQDWLEIRGEIRKRHARRN
jgi:antitoxin ParD1/3/4